MKNYVRTGIEKFSTATSMHGFAELYLAKSLFFTISWIVVILVSLVMTAYQVYGAIYQYVNQPEAVSIEPMTAGDPMIYPRLQLCYQHWVYWVDFEAAYELNFTKEGVLYGMSYLTEVFSETPFDVDEAERNFLSAMASNKFSTLSDFIRAVSRRTPENEDGYQEKEAKNTYFEPGEIRLLYQLQMPAFCYGIPGEVIHKKIRDRVDGGFEKRFRFYVSDRDMNENKYITRLEYNCYVANYFFTYSDRTVYTKQFQMYKKTLPKLPMLLYIDEHSSFEVKVLWEYSEIKLRVKASVYEMKSVENHLCWYGQRETSFNKSCENMCESELQFHNCLCPNLEWATKRGRDRPNELCSYKISFLNDSSACVRIMEEKFKREEFYQTVAPTVARKPDKEKDFCSSNTFDVRRCCVNSTTNGTDLNDCKKICKKRGCEIWTYEINVATVNSESKEFDTITGKSAVKINILYPSEEDILYSRKINIQSWENFIGNVGGLLGVWSGASLISIFQLFYLCCCTECDCCPTAKVFQQETLDKLRRKNNLIGYQFNSAVSHRSV